MQPMHEGYVPPPTDGPNTRQREAAGLPLASGTTAPLPTQTYQYGYAPLQYIPQDYGYANWPVQSECSVSHIAVGGGGFPTRGSPPPLIRPVRLSTLNV